MIRNGKSGDAFRIAEILVEAHERSRYRDVSGVNLKVARGLWHNCVQRHGLGANGGTCAFVSVDRDGVVQGFVMGLIQPLYMIGEALEAQSLFYVARPPAPAGDAERLLDSYINWATAVPGVVAIRDAVTDAVGTPRRTGKLFQRRGFREMGLVYERIME